MNAVELCDGCGVAGFDREKRLWVQNHWLNVNLWGGTNIGDPCEEERHAKHYVFCVSCAPKFAAELVRLRDA